MSDYNPRESWMARNATRLLVVYGFVLVAVTPLLLLADAYVGAVFTGVVGLYMLGGWPAVRRLVRHPKMQITHWWHILRDTRKVHLTEYPDGSTEVAVMKPVRTNGWGWTEDRWNTELRDR